jgi:hypothetical protein
MRVHWYFWLGCAAVYVSLIWWAVSIGYGPERTITSRYYYSPKSPGGELYREVYPDQGTSPPLDTVIWKLSSFYGDAGFYLMQVNNQNSIAPYHYRIFPTTMVSIIVRITGLPATTAFMLFNALCAFLAAMLFTRYLLDCYSLSPDLALLGGVLTLTMLPTIRTLVFPMIDPCAQLLMLCIIYAVAVRNVFAFIVASVLGVATKEPLAVGAILWFIVMPSLWGGLIAAVPVLTFAGLRVAMGGAPFEANYGYNVLAGELPSYILRFQDNPVDLLLRIGSAFGLLWIGLGAIPRHRLLREQWIAVPLIILATLLLSSRIARPLGVLFPIVIPGALLLWQQFCLGNNADRQQET